jgi:WD40 repeat protein
MREFYPVISVACLQLHHVVLFLPVESQLSQAYRKKLPHGNDGININTGQEQMWNSCARVLEGHTDKCRTVAFSPDGGQLASGSDDRTIRLWNIQTGALLQVLSGHRDAIHSVAYSPNGTLLASGSTDNSIRI